MAGAERLNRRATAAPDRSSTGFGYLKTSLLVVDVYLILTSWIVTMYGGIYS
jgi:hypothetical protein